MKSQIIFISSVLIFSASAEEKKLFDGKTLSGWKGNDKIWTVEDGAITGKTSAETKIKSNTFLIWQDGQVTDFTLTFSYKFTESSKEKFGNSGMQYRSQVIDETNFVVKGYQADCETGTTYSGILYEEKGRGFLAKRGEQVKISQGESADKPKLEVVSQLGNTDEMQKKIHPFEWNEYKIIAKGNHVQHFINGVKTIDVVDETKEAPKKGILALQIHAGPLMKVQFKNIVLKEEK